MTIHWISRDAERAISTVQDMRRDGMLKFARTPKGGDLWLIHVSAVAMLSRAAVNFRNMADFGFAPVHDDPSWVQARCSEGPAGLVIRLKTAAKRQTQDLGV